MSKCNESRFTRINDCRLTLDNAQKLSRIHSVLSSSIVQSLLRLHPNDLVDETPAEWSQWMSWSRNTLQGWLELVYYFMTGIQYAASSFQPKHDRSSTLPGALLDLLDEIRRVQLSRQPIVIEPFVLERTGMSPKKSHEVSRMTTYVLETIKLNGWDPAVLRIVDVGAGQGYLTRALKAQLPRTHILALDADEAQIIGAQRWERRLLPLPSDEHPAITHRTIHITPETLARAIDEWILETNATEAPGGTQVMLIGLHACGSLTPNVIRAFIRLKGEKRNWRFVACLVVGCCYNLMDTGDFPLSRCMKQLSPFIDLPTSAYHLAAQIPTQWLTKLSPPTVATSVELALRKVTWRALLGKKIRHIPGMTANTSNVTAVNLTPGRRLPWTRLPEAKTQNYDSNEVGTGATLEMRRLGRLRNAAYDDWETFLDIAGKKMGVDFSSVIGDTERDIGSERFLGVVHTLRCLIGPVVESAIILDRMVWIDDMLLAEGQEDLDAKLVNLFDQATGGGRNIAIVIAPSIPLM